MMLSSHLAYLVPLLPIVLAAAPVCKVTFEGRIPAAFTPKTFTTDASPYVAAYVLGEKVTWDTVITFPSVPTSKFDALRGTKAIAIQIDDKSIFRSASEYEPALRRAELLKNKADALLTGNKTWHISVRFDKTAPLNLSHEYVLQFQEAQNYQADFYSLKAGVPMIGGKADDAKKLRVEGYKFDNPIKTFFETSFDEDVWHNFGLNLNYADNKIAIYYSKDNDTLKLVTPPTANNLSGIAPTTLGETHFGLQKRPIGANINNFLTEGTTEMGIKERLIFGGIFQEESGDGCVSL